MAHSTPNIVICGAGIAGVAAAYALTVDHGLDNVVLVEPGIPLSLTSDKSSEAYRNWWPGPDRAMTAFMDRSIDLIEDIARETDNRINLNRRGYVFATSDAGKIPFLREMAQMAEARGGGPARFHDTPSSAYTPSPSTASTSRSPGRTWSPMRVSSAGTFRFSQPRPSRWRMRGAPAGSAAQQLGGRDAGGGARARRQDRQGQAWSASRPGHACAPSRWRAKASVCGSARTMWCWPAARCKARSRG